MPRRDQRHVKADAEQVSDKFVMLVPLYLQMQNGSTTRIANLVLHGSNTLDHTVCAG